MSIEESSVNNGEHMYYKNLAHKIIRQNKIEETKKNDEDNFTAEFSFKPHFLKTEADNYSKVKSRIYRESVPVYKYTDENTTFQPNKNTKTIELKTDEDIKKMTNRLHSEQKKFLENKEKLSKNQIKDECTFKPKINVPGKSDPKYFMMRLEKWSKKIEDKNKENLERKKNLGTNNPFNDKKKMFHPEVRDPIAKKIKRENQVHIDLYNKGLEHIDYRKSIMTTDTRVDLAKIENDKKERIKNLKEERERYKKDKKEKMEKEITERTLKAKAEKEKMDKIIAEKTELILNRMENKELAKIKEKEMLEKKRKLKNKKKATSVTKDKKLKNKANTTNKIKPKTAGKSAPKIQEKIEKEKTTSKKNPLSSKQRVNTKTTKLDTIKEKETKVIKSEKLIKKEEKGERNKSQPPKNKKKEEINKKEAKNEIVNKEEKQISKEKKNLSKRDNSYAKKVKTAKNNIKNLLINKNEVTKEVAVNNLKNNKKGNNIRVTKTEYNVSVEKKSENIKKEKKVKK